MPKKSTHTLFAMVKLAMEWIKAECEQNIVIARTASTTQQKRTCKIMQESCKNLACKTCLARARDMSLFLHVSCTILAQSCTYLARNGARFCKSCCKNNYLHFLHIFCKILQELVHDCARIVQEKGHIECTCQASLACKILARFLHNLA